MSEPRWKGYIKDYNGSTMMQCRIIKDVDYVNISETLRKQKEAIIDKINEVMLKKRYEGLSFTGEVYAFEEIPGLKEAGWDAKAYEEAK